MTVNERSNEEIVEDLRKGIDNDGYHSLTDKAEKLMKEAADRIIKLDMECESLIKQFYHSCGND